MDTRQTPVEARAVLTNTQTLQGKRIIATKNLSHLHPCPLSMPSIAIRDGVEIGKRYMYSGTQKLAGDRKH